MPRCSAALSFRTIEYASLTESHAPLAEETKHLCVVLSLKQKEPDGFKVQNFSF